MLWFFWHYSILANPLEMLGGAQKSPLFIGVPLMLGMLSLLSLLPGSTAIRTRAVLFPVLLHYIGKVGDGRSLLLVFVATILVYSLWSKVIESRHPPSLKRLRPHLNLMGHPIASHWLV